MIQSWENLVKDGQTDESDFTGRCPTDVERPIWGFLNPIIDDDIKIEKCWADKDIVFWTSPARLVKLQIRMIDSN